MSFGAARFLLGVGEAANFPASIKTVAEWFPKSERALRDGHLQLRARTSARSSPRLRVPLHRGGVGMAGRRSS